MRIAMMSRSDHAAERVRARAENRRNFPFTSALIDELKRVFGPGISLVWARENGREIGRKEGMDWDEH